jgi:hypothetical protein
MAIRPVVCGALAAVALIVASLSPAAAQSGGPAPCAPLVPAADGSDLGRAVPVLKTHTYRMAGRARPLLFWIGRDDVGSARIVWRGGGAELGYELLIGTDPAKAPRSINRWGFIVEHVTQADARVFGVMSTSEEVTLTDVSKKLDQVQTRGRFKALEAVVAPGGNCFAIGTLETDRDLTIHESAALERHARGRLTSVPQRGAAVPAGARSGFLVAVAELIDAVTKASQEGPAALRRMKGRSIPYVYGRNVLDVAITNTPSPVGDGRAQAALTPVHVEFELRSRISAERYHFEIDFATSGPLAGVPVTVRYQPRWWLQAELTLEDKPGRIVDR